MSTVHPQLGREIGYYQGLSAEGKGKLAAYLYGGPIVLFAILWVVLGLTGLWWQPAVGIVPGIALFLWLWWRARRTVAAAPALQRIWLYEDGMVVIDGETRHAFGWQQVFEMHHSAMIFTSGQTVVNEQHLFMLRIDDGGSFTMRDDVVNPTQLTTEVKKRVTKARLPIALHAIESGARVPFGSLTVTAEGIGGEDILPWSQVRGVKVDKGEVIVASTADGNWCKTPLGTVPNVDLLIALYRRLSVAR